MKQIEKYRQQRPGNMQLELESRCVTKRIIPMEEGRGVSPSFLADEKQKAAPEPVHFDPPLIPDDPYDYVKLAKEGVTKAEGRPAVVAIIGAGASGLVAGLELLRAGHYPLIFEASDRIGGRLFTVRDFDDPRVYAEMGSMRVPPVHKTLMHYLNHFNIPTRKFPNPNNVKTCYYVNGKKEFGSPDQQVPWVKHLYEKWDQTIRPFAETLQKVWNDPAQRDQTWAGYVEQYSTMSFRDFLKSQGWTGEEMELFSVVGFGVGGYGPLFQVSFLEMLRINVCRWDDDQMEIVGGNDLLAIGLHEHHVELEDGEEASLKDLGLVMTKTAVTAIQRDETAGKLLLTTAKGDQFMADAVILTAQARAIQMEMHIQRNLLTNDQWQAIYNTHFMSSGKIFLETETAFWNEKGSELTTTITDLPIRGVYLFDFPNTESGLICASYTWEDDSRKWHASTIEQRAQRAIDMLEEIYGKNSVRPHVVSAYGFSWEEMPGYRGAFKQLYPGQYHYTQALMEPSNNIWFAGDGVSHAGGWIEGALQSGLKAAKEIAENFTA
jgi:monoamine oxidase